MIVKPLTELVQLAVSPFFTVQYTGSGMYCVIARPSDLERILGIGSHEALKLSDRLACYAEIGENITPEGMRAERRKVLRAAFEAFDLLEREVSEALTANDK